ncbi:hypothetical protein MIT9_P2289 [Methylomarinovum caldicuralii]|uniref:Uncharacterized protein n=1 Tax=Methylomarinovum caldicuralii TaxID=438856 RepID=A0AAU9CRV8_9GAMM|nr:hypothetical protein [Methylomarinovum caldicuralii]BCX82703.1 hypothetical protein MIT9_P2289 [Methylomarinovum caldicuralii]
MRFFVSGEHYRKALLYTCILLFLGYLVLFAVSAALMYFNHMDLSPASVVDYYLGNEAEFRPPRSYQSLLEVSHFHLFAQGMLAMTLVHLLLMTELPVWLKIGLGATAFFSAVANEAAGWLVRFVHPAFAWLKVGTFLALEGSLLLLVLCIGGSLLRPVARPRPWHRKR